eukprot:TRINITY_DN1462_c0_g1_i1.p1 TRINITY_DN1462_c0_g1~~TRINITY_DN1462_c0_g1_i1.p1  ORF type:complete len:338 (+),score=109.03 TRINITY_DN1462_c0_g1_i1:133-1146(+)
MDWRRGMSLTYPDHKFWRRMPLAPSQAENLTLYTLDAEDNLSIECAKIFVAERSRREKIVKEEKTERVCQIKQVVYELHLERTERITKEDVGHDVVQARPVDTTIVLEVLWAEEDRERATIDQFEYDAGTHLFEKVWPAMVKQAKAIAAARDFIIRKEQGRRHALVQEWEQAHQVLIFRRSILRHTEQVVTRMNREDNRVCAISEKLDRLAYRSLVRDTFDVAVPNSPSLRPPGTPPRNSYIFPSESCGTARTVPDERGSLTPAVPTPAPPRPQQALVPVASASRPVPQPCSPGDRLVELQADVEFLETHITGLRALRQIEEEKLRAAQEQLQRLGM